MVQCSFCYNYVVQSGSDCSNAARFHSGIKQDSFLNPQKLISIGSQALDWQKPDDGSKKGILIFQWLWIMHFKDIFNKFQKLERKLKLIMQRITL